MGKSAQGRAIPGILVVVVALLAACVCAEERLGPYEKTVASDVYTESVVTTNTEIESISWHNRTTGQSGTGQITYPYYTCIMLAGCGNWLRYEVSVPVAVGFNKVEIDLEESDCSHTIYEYHLTRQ